MTEQPNIMLPMEEYVQMCRVVFKLHAEIENLNSYIQYLKNEMEETDASKTEESIPETSNS